MSTENAAAESVIHAPRLHAAWARYHATLDEMRVAVETSPQFIGVPAQRARAYHQLVEAQAIAYNFALAPRTAHPRLFHNTSWQTDMYGSGGNGPDFHYATLFLDGAQRYLLTGHVRDSKMLLAQHNNTLPGSPGSRMLGNYDFSDFEIAPDGSFTITLSADKAEGNWIELDRDAGYQWLLFRPSIEGWDQTPAELSVTRLSTPPADEGYDDDFSEEYTARRIDMAADFVRYIVQEWMLAFYPRVTSNAGGINLFKPIGPAISGEVGSPTAEYVLAAYQVDDDEALILELAEPPNGIYWGIQIFDVWLRPVNFRTRQSTLNSAQITPDADGAVRIVLSRQDPGVAHWLDNGGYSTGQALIRNYRSTRPAQPAITRVKLAALDQHMPPETRRVTPAARAAELANRSAAYLRRHGE